MFVLDASVVAKWFKHEEDREKALQLRKYFVEGKADIVVPDLLLIEITNLLRFSKVFELEDVKQALESIRDLDITIVVPTFEILIKASSLAFKFDITVYDSVYLATAEYIGYEFITADQKLYYKVRKLGYIKLLKDIELAD